MLFVSPWFGISSHWMHHKSQDMKVALITPLPLGPLTNKVFISKDSQNATPLLPLLWMCDLIMVLAETTARLSGLNNEYFSLLQSMRSKIKVQFWGTHFLSCRWPLVWVSAQGEQKSSGSSFSSKALPHHGTHSYQGPEDIMTLRWGLGFNIRVCKEHKSVRNYQVTKSLTFCSLIHEAQISRVSIWCYGARGRGSKSKCGSLWQVRVEDWNHLWKYSLNSRAR